MSQYRKRFKVTVNGREFDVEVEPLQESGTGPIGAAPATPPTVTPAPVAAAPSSAPAASGAPGEVASPMAGKVLKVPVKKGAKVAAGDVLVVLEAMKMETNVNAAQDGVVDEIFVAEGDSVDAGAPLVRIK